MKIEEKILLVVDPTDAQHAALDRLLLALPTRNPMPEVYVLVVIDTETVDTRATNDNLFRDQSWFEDTIRKPLETLGVNYTLGVSWSTQWQQAILSEAKHFGADSIMLPFHERKNRLRLTFSESKWDLFKTADCPVVLLRPQGKAERKIVLAAVNFQATRDTQRELNETILTMGKNLEQAYDAELHVVNGYLDSMLYPDRGRLARETGVQAERIHVEQGYTDEVVSAVAKQINADLVIIGTLGQTGASKTRRGNTAERVITSLETDVAVVNHQTRR